MRRCMNILLLCAVAMAGAIIYALVTGNFLEEAGLLFPLPWFQLALADLYLGFLLFGGWILYRERSHGRAVGWIIILCLLGNIASCIYAVRALVQARGDWQQFWLGHHASGSAES